MNFYEFMIESLKKSVFPYSIATNPLGEHVISVWFKDGLTQFVFSADYELTETIASIAA